MVEAPHDTRRLYHSRAARDDRAGPFPLQEDTKRSDVTLHALRASPCFWQAGWNRGTYDDASPLTHSGVRRFLFCPEPAGFPPQGGSCQPEAD